MNKNAKKGFREIGTRLKLVRTSLGLSIEKTGEMTGFSRSLISEAENGYKKPSSIYLKGLAGLFHANINYILTGEGEMFLTGGHREIERDEEIKELLYLMKNVNLVKYSVLSFFIDFKTRNKDVIQELLDDSLEKKKQEKEVTE